MKQSFQINFNRVFIFHLTEHSQTADGRVFSVFSMRGAKAFLRHYFIHQESLKFVPRSRQNQKFFKFLSQKMKEKLARYKIVKKFFVAAARENCLPSQRGPIRWHPEAFTASPRLYFVTS